MRPFPAKNFRVSFLLSVLLLAMTAAHAVIPNNVTSRNYFGTLTFNRAVHVAALPGLDSHFVVLEQWLSTATSVGQVSLVRSVGGTWTKSVFDTVTFSGTVSSNREMGLLSVAFHPAFAQNRKYYLSYTPSYTNGGNPPARIHVVERRADSTLLKRDAAVASRVLLNVTQSGNTQKGGNIAFGPSDGFLYVGLGDGGGNGDPSNMAQNADSLQGKILRVDVNATSAGKEYAIPSDNPFTTGKTEVWVKGFRNPWRWTIHPVRNELWVADVGTNLQDEISLAPKGGNMGWNIREGNSCFPSTVTNCTTTGLTAPLVTRNAGATIGGVFFLGQASGQFNDTYIFGNGNADSVYAMRITNGAVADAARGIAGGAAMNNISSLATDPRGRVLAVKLGTSGTGQNINANTGIVSVLESPDMVLNPVVALRHAAPGAGAPRFTRADVLRNRDQYIIKTLDGRHAAEIPSGAFLAARKGSAGPAQILTSLWD
jgi:glucose/arabinose dehydrogenase